MTTSQYTTTLRVPKLLGLSVTPDDKRIAGFLGGDGKASNALIHCDTGDAWIIDFGGGWTDGWVDQELGGTMEGDELAVNKILEFLNV